MAWLNPPLWETSATAPGRGASVKSALNVAEQSRDHYPWNVVRGSVRADSEWTVRSPIASEPLSAG